LKKICGLWEHGEWMTEYIPSTLLRTSLRCELLPAALVVEVWAKWFSAMDNVVLFNEVRRLAAFESGG
jgi:hypothetical protein